MAPDTILLTDDYGCDVPAQYADNRGEKETDED